MKWTVTVSDPLNQTVLAEFENGARTSDGQIAIRRFDPPTVVPPGAPRNLNLYVRQDLAQIPPRAIIQLAFDDTPVFWGPVIISPPLNSPGAGPADEDRDSLERITVAGGEQLLRDSIVGPRLLDSPALEELGSADVAAIAHELCSLYAHPALIVDEVNFPATGGVLDIFYKPESTLFDALTDLAGTVPGSVAWVDALGEIHLEGEGGES